MQLDQIQTVRDTFQSILRADYISISDIKQLEKHHSIVKISSEKPKYIRDRAFWELYNDLKSN